MPTLAPRLDRTDPDAPPPLDQDKGRSSRCSARCCCTSILLLVLGWVVPHWPHAKLRGNPPPDPSDVHPLETRRADRPQASGNSSRRTTCARSTNKEPTSRPTTPTSSPTRTPRPPANSPPTGDKPLPTQDGREIPTFDFDTRPVPPGKEAQDAASAAPAAPPPPDQPKQDAGVKKPAPHTKALHPPETAVHARSRAGELAAASPTPPHPRTAHAGRKRPTRPARRRPSRASRSATPPIPRVNSPGLPHPPGYQPQTIKSKVERRHQQPRPVGRRRAWARRWAVTRKRWRMPSGCSGINTPSSAWTCWAPGRSSCISTSTARGKVEKVARFLRQAEQRAGRHFHPGRHRGPIPPIPPEIAATLDGGQSEYDFGFGVY